MRSSVFIAVAIVALIAALQPTDAIPRPIDTLLRTLGDSYDKFCSDLDRHTMFPFKCISEEQYARQANATLFNLKATAGKVLEPVVFFPGLTGSGLEAEFKKSDSAGLLCRKERSWFQVWIDSAEILTPACWIDSMMVYYNEETDSYDNTPGVNIRAKDFGGVTGFEYLAYLWGVPLPIKNTYHEFVSTFKAAGYKPGVNFRGATYDWRKPVTELFKDGFGQSIQALIEDTYAKNGNQPVHIVGHSMGGPTSLFFLNSMTDAWKEKYIKSYNPIAAPWSGSPNAVRAIISGEALNMGDDIRLTFRSLTRNAGGPIYLLPNAAFWPKDQVFVTTNERSYTIADFPQLFQDVGTPETALVFSKVKDIINGLQAPNVPTNCIYGTDVPTEIAFKYNSGNWDDEPEIVYSNSGDGVVPIESLTECQNWASQMSAPINIHEVDMDAGSHFKIIQDPAVIQYLLSLFTHD